jgi:hypothetical protein
MSLFPVNFMKYFSEQPSVRKGNIQGINSLDCPHFVSFVVTVRIVSTLTIMCHCRSRCDAGVYLKQAVVYEIVESTECCVI